MTTDLEGVAREKRVERYVNVLEDVFDERWVAEFDALFEFLEVKINVDLKFCKKNTLNFEEKNPVLSPLCLSVRYMCSFQF